MKNDFPNKGMVVVRDETSIQQISNGKLETEVNTTCISMDEKQTGGLLFDKDPSLWKTDPDQIKQISRRLGWLTLPDYFARTIKDLSEFALTIKREGYTHAVLLGMGGSSLCSEVTRKTFSIAEGYLQLFVLDNTDPSAILALEKKINIAKTLFIVASKSGNTEETLSFFRYFYNQLEKRNKDNPGNNFVAITDDSTPLVKVAQQYQFRKVFVNPSDLGGRYSVLSNFGLVPMALMGIDIKSFLSSAKQMESHCHNVPASTNPGIRLGVVLGICQRYDRDKVTFILSSSLSSFGYWLEQLLAESTGKEGRGLIPINGESIGAPDVYGTDRLFIHIYLSSDDNEDNEKKLKALEEAGHPIVIIKVRDKIALGGEYYRWEVAVAIAGIIIGINPFDQPNVEESKKNTSQLLEDWSKEGSFKKSTPLLKFENISIYSGNGMEKFIATNYRSAGDLINSFILQAKPNDYISLLPYFLMTDNRTKVLQSWRQQMRDKLKIATTLLNGPRYLHSTGQLHKGGPNTGLYILLIGNEEKDLPISGQKFGFSTLHQAQALGDFRSLNDKGRRIIRIHLGKDIDDSLDKLYQSIKDASKQNILKEAI